MRERGPLGVLGSILIWLEWFIIGEVLALMSPSWNDDLARASSEWPRS
jgi:hypothetical protein